MSRVLYMRENDSNGDDDGDDGAWDDTALERAYDRVMSSARRELGLEPAPSHQQKTNDKTWRVGDTCRARYTEDGVEYEAEVISVDNGYPQPMYQLRFVGYGNTQYCTEDEVKPSLGKKARKRQQKEAEAETEAFATVGAEGVDQRAASDNSRKPSRQTKHATNHPLPNGETHHGDCHPPPRHTISGYSPYHCAGYTHQPPIFPPNPHCYRTAVPHVPPPPLYCGPPASARACDDEALTAMLMSWYLSGYHTGYYAGTQEAGARRHGTH